MKRLPFDEGDVLVGVGVVLIAGGAYMAFGPAAVLLVVGGVMSLVGWMRSRPR